MKFLLNSILDTLPTNTNLALWNKRVSESCKLCGSRETLGHVLNGCKVMLEQQRYTWRHNNVLSQIKTSITSVIENDDITVYCDLPGSGHFTIPPDLVPTTDRPDLVIIDRLQKEIHILELTVCFESNQKKAHEYKSEKYNPLLIDLTR